MRLGVCDGRCPAALAQERDIAFLRERVKDLEGHLGDLAGVRASARVGAAPPPPVPPRKAGRVMAPWSQGLLGGDHARLPVRKTPVNNAPARPEADPTSGNVES